jgi:hypothetical protein
MNSEPVTSDLAAGVSPVTTPVIVYDDAAIAADLAKTFDALTLSAKDTVGIKGTTAKSKRGTLLPQIVFASSLMAFTTPSISLPDLQLSGPTHLPTYDQTEYIGIGKSRRITLREAREMALEAHQEFERGLRRDRIQEARLFELAANENEA